MGRRADALQESDSSEKYIHLGLGWIADRGGGLERYQHGICLAHSQLGVDVTAWVQSRNSVGGNQGYAVTAFASQTEKRSRKLQKLRRLAIERFTKPDFTFVSHHASVSASLVDLTKRVPHVVHFQGPWADEAKVEGAPWWKTLAQRRQERLAYRSADRIIVLSEAFKRLIIDNYAVRPEDVHVIPGAINTSAADPLVSRREARERLNWPSERPTVLAVRRLVRRVGVDVLIDAAARCLQNKDCDKDLLILIGGTGPLEDELKKKILSLGVERNVQLLGFVPDENLSLAYRAADLSVVPTQSLEGFGLVTLESLAAGTPTLVTPVGSLPEVVTPLSSTLVLSEASVEYLCEALRLFSVGKLALPTTDECQAYVREHYDWTVIAPRVLDVYRQAGSTAHK